MEWKYEKYTIHKDSSDKRGLTILNEKPAELSLCAIVSMWGLQESVLSSVSPRNFVLLTIVIFLLPCIISKSLGELFLVIKCM
jgi:hypothetical protein